MSEVIIGKYGDRYLTAKGQQFILLAAPTGSGKGVAIVLPNLLNYPGSVVVLDLKLENFRLTSGYRQRHGQQVYLFAPFSEDGMTHRWNMLDAISRNSLLRVGDILAIGQSFYPSDCDPKEKFWNDNARNLFLALVLYLMETPELPCTLGEVFRQSSGKGRSLKEHLQQTIARRSRSASPLSDDCLDAMARFLATPDNTLGNIISTFNAPLLIFANPIVDAATSTSDFRLDEVRKRPMTLYIGIQPNRLSDAALLINMLFSQLIDLNTKELPANNPLLKYECLLVMDEFTALGKINIVAKANPFIRDYLLRLLILVQSIAQLISVYGDTDARTLVTNHAVQIVYPPREQKDANDYSQMLGYLTQKAVSTGSSRPRGWGSAASVSENSADHARALMLPQELKAMPPHQQIIFVENCRPILCEKARYYLDHRFLDRLKSVSPALASLDATPARRTLRKLGLHHWSKARPTEKQLKHAAFVSHELSAAIPFIDLAQHRPRAPLASHPSSHPKDLSVLNSDRPDLPGFADPERPTKQEATALINAFFRQWDLDETESPEQDAAGKQAPEQSTENGIECADDAFDCAPAAPPRPAIRKPIDLSVLNP